MKKFALLCAVALLLSSAGVGCSSNGNGLGSFCRTGSIFPVARTKDATQVVYQTAGLTASRFAQCDPCTPLGCDPCEPVSCNPCEPVSCNPCEPVCDPCIPRGVIGRPPIPGAF